MLFDEKQTWRCAGCGMVNNPDMRFCEYCGQERPAPESLPVCPSCGAQALKSMQRFCRICGKPMDAQSAELPKPVAEEAPAEELCAHCGLPNGIGKKYCRHCGKPMRLPEPQPEEAPAEEVPMEEIPAEEVPTEEIQPEAAPAAEVEESVAEEETVISAEEPAVAEKQLDIADEEPIVAAEEPVVAGEQPIPDEAHFADVPLFVEDEDLTEEHAAASDAPADNIIFDIDGHAIEIDPIEMEEDNFFPDEEIPARDEEEPAIIDDDLVPLFDLPAQEEAPAQDEPILSAPDPDVEMNPVLPCTDGLCPECGAINPPDRVFCGECGLRLIW